MAKPGFSKDGNLTEIQRASLALRNLVSNIPGDASTTFTFGDFATFKSNLRYNTNQTLDWIPNNYLFRCSMDSPNIVKDTSVITIRNINDVSPDAAKGTKNLTVNPGDICLSSPASNKKDNFIIFANKPDSGFDVGTISLTRGIGNNDGIAADNFPFYTGGSIPAGFKAGPDNLQITNITKGTTVLTDSPSAVFVAGLGTLSYEASTALGGLTGYRKFIPDAKDDDGEQIHQFTSEYTFLEAGQRYIVSGQVFVPEGQTRVSGFTIKNGNDTPAKEILPQAIKPNVGVWNDFEVETNADPYASSKFSFFAVDSSNCPTLLNSNGSEFFAIKGLTIKSVLPIITTGAVHRLQESGDNVKIKTVRNAEGQYQLSISGVSIAGTRHLIGEATSTFGRPIIYTAADSPVINVSRGGAGFWEGTIAITNGQAESIGIFGVGNYPVATGESVTVSGDSAGGAPVTGTHTISNPTGSTDLDSRELYADIISTTKFSLYEDIDLTESVNSIDFDAPVSPNHVDNYAKVDIKGPDGQITADPFTFDNEPIAFLKQNGASYSPESGRWTFGKDLQFTFTKGDLISKIYRKGHNDTPFDTSPTSMYPLIIDTYNVDSEGRTQFTLKRKGTPGRSDTPVKLQLQPIVKFKDSPAGFNTFAFNTPSGINGVISFERQLPVSEKDFLSIVPPTLRESGGAGELVALQVKSTKQRGSYSNPYIHFEPLGLMYNLLTENEPGVGEPIGEPDSVGNYSSSTFPIIEEDADDFFDDTKIQTYRNALDAIDDTIGAAKEIAASRITRESPFENKSGFDIIVDGALIVQDPGKVNSPGSGAEFGFNPFSDCPRGPAVYIKENLNGVDSFNRAFSTFDGPWTGDSTAGNKKIFTHGNSPGHPEYVQALQVNTLEFEDRVLIKNYSNTLISTPPTTTTSQDVNSKNDSPLSGGFQQKMPIVVMETDPDTGEEFEQTYYLLLRGPINTT